MADLQVIYISNQFVTFYAIGRNRVSQILRLSAQAVEYSIFVQYLKGLGQVPVRIVVDLKEELLHYETVPHLIGSDRKALLERKIRQVAGDSSFTSVHRLGRESCGRKDDQILVCALPQTDGLPPSWLDYLFKCKVPISGMFSAAVICEMMCKDIAKDRDVLLISTSGISARKLSVRQSFFREGKLVLSRLSFKAVSDTIISDIFNEINRTRSYLLRAHSLDRVNDLEVHFVTDKIYIDAAHKKSSELVQIELNNYTFEEFSKRLGLESMPEPQGFEAIIAHQAARRSFFQTQYSNKITSFYYRHHMAKRIMQMVSGALLIGALSYASACWLDIQQSKVELVGVQNKISRIANLLRNTPPIILTQGYTPTQIKSFIRSDEIIRDKSILLTAVLEPISRTLSTNLSIQINKVGWQRPAQDNAADQLNGMDSYQNNQSAIGDATDSAVLDVEAISDSGKKAVVYATIHGEVVAFNGNYRKAHRQIEDWVASLNRQHGIISATASRLPMDIRPTVDISGEVRNTEVLKDTAIFTVEAIVDYRADSL